MSTVVTAHAIARLVTGLQQSEQNSIFRDGMIISLGQRHLFTFSRRKNKKDLLKQSLKSTYMNLPQELMYISVCDVYLRMFSV